MQGGRSEKETGESARIRLFESALRETKPQIDEAARLLQRLKTETLPEETKRRLFAEIAVLMTFVKRHANLKLLEEVQKTLPLQELHFCLRESAEALALLPVSMLYTQEMQAEETMDSARMWQMYDRFEAEMEAVLSQIDRLRMQLVSTKDSVELLLRMAGRQMPEKEARIVMPLAGTGKDSGVQGAEDARSEEYLATKVHIHDMLGQVLLSTRYYLTEQNVRVTEEELKASWQRVIGELQGGQVATSSAKEPFAPDLRKALSDAATAIGLSLHTEGDFANASAALSREIVRAARVCMTNAVRHGAATEMKITLSAPGGARRPGDAGSAPTEAERRGRIRTVRFANNGLVPRDVTPGGGLKSLERRMEQAGGQITYEQGEEFTVILTLREGG